MTTNNEQSDADAEHIIEVAEAAATPAVLSTEEIQSVVVPNGGELRVLDLESKRATPRRKRGELVFWDSASFSAYVNVHKGDGTNLLLDDRVPQVVGVLNGDSASSAGWGDHKAVLAFRKTDAWTRWLALNENFVEQEQFAEHIERNLVDIVDPTGADLLELAQTFEATTSAEFRSQKRLANGQRQFTYSENIEGKGGANGQLEIPETFKLAVAPFEGCEPYGVTARLRFRLNAGHLKLGYVIDNPRDIETQAVGDVSKMVASATSLTVLFGAVSIAPAASE